MFLNNVRIRSAVVGGLGGFIGWLLFSEPLWAPLMSSTGGNFGRLLFVDALFGGLFGLGLGLVLGAAEGVFARSRYQIQRGGLIGAVAGLVGGAIGLMVGEIVYQPLSSIGFIGRSIGWAVFGALLGIAQGMIRRSWLGMRSAFLGGLIGGAIGGFMFDLVGFTIGLLTGSDGLSRGVALTILGACIGLWIALIERALAPALLKVISGPLEGREFLLDKPLLVLGSDERNDIPIFGDPAISKRHLTLRSAQKTYLAQAEPGAALAINGQAAAQQPLRHEDQLLIGRTRLLFRQKTPTVAPGPSLAPTPVAGQSIGSQRMSAALFLVDEHSARRYPLGAGITRIGRAPDNDIVLDDASVSGYHAEIRYEDGRYLLYDQGSSNGSYVNGRRLSGPNLIKAGWQLQFGDSILQVAG